MAAPLLLSLRSGLLVTGLLVASCAQSSQKIARADGHLVRASDLGQGWQADRGVTNDAGPDDCLGGVQGTGAVRGATATLIMISSPHFQVTEQLISANDQQATAFRALYVQVIPQCEPNVVAVEGVSGAPRLGYTGPILTEVKGQPGLVTQGFTPDPPGTHRWHFLDRTSNGFVLLEVHGDEVLLRRAVTAAKNRAL